MIPVVQRIVASGYDDTLPGDCVKACVASILELPYDAVPHFVAGEVLGDDGKTRLDWLGGMRKWFERARYGCVPIHRSYFKHVECQQAWYRERAAAGIIDTTGRDCLWLFDATDQTPYHEGYWIASVISENFAGGTHAIVMNGNTVAHDPSPYPRREPYRYVGELRFIATNPAISRSAA